MKIVLDTNFLLISISSRTVYGVIFQAFQLGAFELCVTTDILDEYAEKLEEKFRPGLASGTMDILEKSPDVIFIHKYFSGTSFPLTPTTTNSWIAPSPQALILSFLTTAILIF